MKELNILIFPSVQSNKIEEIGSGMQNAAAHYAKKYIDGTFYLMVPKDYGDVTEQMSDNKAEFWKDSILVLLQPNKELIEKKGYRNRDLSPEELKFVLNYIGDIGNGPKPSDFIGKKAIYDNEGQIIWAEDKNGGIQQIINVRGWGAIQNLFKNEDQSIDLPKAIKFQDDLGAWITEAINEKLEREKHS